MSNIDNKLIESLTTLVADLLQAPQENPKGARRYVRARGKVELAMRLIGGGERRELKRPQSIGLPIHEKRVEEEPKRYEPESDILADNMEETEEPKPKPRKK